MPQLSNEELADAIGIPKDQITPELLQRIGELNSQYDANMMAKADAVGGNIDSEIAATEAAIPRLGIEPQLSIDTPPIEPMPPRWEPFVPETVTANSGGEIPFINAYRGPAGEYSDRYKAIVDNYRNEVESAQLFRQMQAGIPPIAGLQSRLQAPRPQVFKSGNDLVKFDPATGEVGRVYTAPPIPQRVTTPPVERPYTSPERLALIGSAKTAREFALKNYAKANAAFIKDPTDTAAIEGRRVALRDLAKAEADFKSVVSPQQPAAPVAEAKREAVGGYKIGTRYKGGLIYLGGDPKSQDSWKKAE